MELYILRHAIAIPRGTLVYPNDDRPLTKEGISKMKEVAKGMAKILPRLDAVISSPLVRARHTAELAVDALPFDGSIEISEQLLPGSLLQDLYQMLSRFNAGQNILLVGHEPDLGLLVSALLGAKGSVIEFKKGGLCCVEVDKLPPARGALLRWHLSPKQLRLLGRK